MSGLQSTNEASRIRYELFSTLSAEVLFLGNLYPASFLRWRDIPRDLFFREDFELFFHIGVEKTEKSSQK